MCFLFFIKEGAPIKHVFKYDQWLQQCLLNPLMQDLIDWFVPSVIFLLPYTQWLLQYNTLVKLLRPSRLVQSYEINNRPLK